VQIAVEVDVEDAVQRTLIIFWLIVLTAVEVDVGDVVNILFYLFNIWIRYSL